MNAAVAEKKAVEAQRIEQSSAAATAARTAAALFEESLRAANAATNLARGGEEAAYENLREHVASEAMRGRADYIPRRVVKEEMQKESDFYNMFLDTEMRNRDEDEKQVRFEFSEMSKEKSRAQSEVAEAQVVAGKWRPHDTTEEIAERGR